MLADDGLDVHLRVQRRLLFSMSLRCLAAIILFWSYFLASCLTLVSFSCSLSAFGAASRANVHHDNQDQKGETAETQSTERVLFYHFLFRSISLSLYIYIYLSLYVYIYIYIYIHIYILLLDFFYYQVLHLGDRPEVVLHTGDGGVLLSYHY